MQLLQQNSVTRRVSFVPFNLRYSVQPQCNTPISERQKKLFMQGRRVHYMCNNVTLYPRQQPLSVKGGQYANISLLFMMQTLEHVIIYYRAEYRYCLIHNYARHLRQCLFYSIGNKSTDRHIFFCCYNIIFISLRNKFSRLVWYYLFGYYDPARITFLSQIR